MRVSIEGWKRKPPSANRHRPMGIPRNESNMMGEHHEDFIGSQMQTRCQEYGASTSHVGEGLSVCGVKVVGAGAI